MTRLPGVLGGFQHWTSAPQDDSFDYFIAPSKCFTLNDIAKLNDAQNDVSFALDITAKHEYTSREVGKDAPNKGQYTIWWLREGAGGRRESP
ncbi:unnamed protein product [Colletotrichum noveboracense]|uniref:Uncharacterized protein n=1 Tax=Colletotrichum noveboracense TaxID=2664923 RepID=A0A9W4W4G7_9PEZI|nr:unnamed protein product [Colletotrichum noveboracense]